MFVPFVFHTFNYRFRMFNGSAHIRNVLSHILDHADYFIGINLKPETF